MKITSPDVARMIINRFKKRKKQPTVFIEKMIFGYFPRKVKLEDFRTVLKNKELLSKVYFSPTGSKNMFMFVFNGFLLLFM